MEGAISRKYIVVTPCKNEGKNLPDLIESVVAQTIRPVLWVIVDDGSTDDTDHITQEAAEKYDWIYVMRLNQMAKRDLGLHLADVMKKGFDYAISYCNKLGLDYNYLGNLDGDLIIPPTFYENLIKKFEDDSTLGIAGGGIKLTIGKQLVYAKGLPEDEPSGGTMLIRKACFKECSGIPISYSLDSVIKAKARMKGWKAKRFEDNIATEIRDVNSAESYWKGYVHSGRAAYYLNLNPMHALVRGMLISLRKPYYTGIAYLVGYFSNSVLRKEQIDDNMVKEYFWNKWKYSYKYRLIRRPTHEILK